MLKKQPTRKKSFSGKDPKGESIRMDPERSICPAYDSTGISKNLPKNPLLVLDNACEEHMM